jgi:hypothetical protein
LLIFDQAVREHVLEYRQSQKLKPESGGSEEKLSEKLSKQLSLHLKEPHIYTSKILMQIIDHFKLYIKSIQSFLQDQACSFKQLYI